MKKYLRKTSNIKRKLKNKTTKRTKKISKKVGGARFKDQINIDEEVEELYNDLLNWISTPSNRAAAYANPITPTDFSKVTAKYGGMPSYKKSVYVIDPDQYSITHTAVLRKFDAKGDLFNLPAWSKDIIASTITLEALLRP
jgi:hypothetical protein